MFQEGDVVEIPLPDGRRATGWILHISHTFKNAVGFIVFGIEGVVRDVDVESSRSLDVLGPLYTHIDAIRHYGWKTVKHHPITDNKRMLTKRTVGGGVYVGDQYLGSIEELGESNLKPMLMMGMPVVYRKIEQAFAR